MHKDVELYEHGEATEQCAAVPNGSIFVVSLQELKW